MRLNDDEVASLMAASRDSVFSEFWALLLDAVRRTRMAPVRLLGPRAPSCRLGAATKAVARLRAVECPFDLTGSKWGHHAMVTGFRRLAAKAGIAGAEAIEFTRLYA